MHLDIVIHVSHQNFLVSLILSRENLEAFCVIWEKLFIFFWILAVEKLQSSFRRVFEVFKKVFGVKIDFKAFLSLFIDCKINLKKIFAI